MESNVSHTAVLYIDPRTDLEGVAKNSQQKAETLLAQANMHLNQSESNFREALQELLNCFWFYKDARISIASDMHKIGWLLHSVFGCSLEFDGEFYCYTCPNILLHKDFGFSIRAISEYGCSICRKPVIECNHITHKEYLVACEKTDVYCNICEAENGLLKECSHQAGWDYKVKCNQITTGLEIITFDIVKEPALVYTRLKKIQIPKEDIEQQVEKDGGTAEFIYGKTTINCHHCHSCKGYDPNQNNFPSAT